MAEDGEQLISDLKQWCQQDGLLTPEATVVPLEAAAAATTVELTLYNISEEQLLKHLTATGATVERIEKRKRRYLGRYFAHPMMQNRRAKRDDYKPSAVRITQRCVP
ncbi:hypothetical protein [Piscirickettsia salmonis]|uniref:hypothetical protein n=1 Tax=Piscirickettsia salmonis TaxID=1238 RepID=UPI000BF02E2C|nr:hypothetical protein [Piscirickettsia salmonis]PEQ17577.1 hypothetical protein X973_01650 [Piscirickettsia salmonis]